jgi:hypothetical protein
MKFSKNISRAIGLILFASCLITTAPAQILPPSGGGNTNRFASTNYVNGFSKAVAILDGLSFSTVQSNFVKVPFVPSAMASGWTIGNGIITAPTNGVIEITATISIPGNASDTGKREHVAVYKNGSINAESIWDYSPGTNADHALSGSISVPVALGDTLAVYLNEAGAARTVTSSVAVVKWCEKPPAVTPMGDPQTFLTTLSSNVLNAAAFTIVDGDFAGDTAWSPAGNAYATYGENMVVRDQVMMIRGFPSYFTTTQIDRVLDILAVLQAANGTDQGVQDGIHGADGSPFGYGGGDLTPSPTDNAFEMIDAFYSRVQIDGSLVKFNQYSSQLVAAFASQTVSNNLVYLDPAEALDVNGHTRVEWGFQDTEQIKGRVLMASLFRYRAARELSEMFARAGDAASATTYTNLLSGIRTSLQTYLWDSTNKWFFACDAVNTGKHHLLGSAYTVVLGACTTNISDLVSSNLITLVGTTNYQNGQSRHLLAPETWSVFQPGISPIYTDVAVYQNGGYWGAFSAWIAKAMKYRDSVAADTFMREYAMRQFYLAANAPYEAENTAVSYSGAAKYAANAMALQYWATRFDR